MDIYYARVKGTYLEANNQHIVLEYISHKLPSDLPKFLSLEPTPLELQTININSQAQVAIDMGERTFHLGGHSFKLDGNIANLI